MALAETVRAIIINGVSCKSVSPYIISENVKIIYTNPAVT
jgi:hypothetical protein